MDEKIGHRGDEAGRGVDGAETRRQQVAREMRSYQINERARSGRVRVRGGSLAPLARQDQISASIVDRGPGPVHRQVDNGRRAAQMIRREGWTVEALAADAKVGPMSILHAIALYDADCAGLLCHTCCDGADPFTMVQAEIAAGIRDFDGEFAGIFASLTDSVDTAGRSANLGEI